MSTMELCSDIATKIKRNGKYGFAVFHPGTRVSVVYKAESGGTAIEYEFVMYDADTNTVTVYDKCGSITVIPCDNILSISAYVHDAFTEIEVSKYEDRLETSGGK